MSLPINQDDKDLPVIVVQTRSDSVQELISSNPGKLVQYGTSIFFLVLLFICFISWFIKYPDIVPVTARLTSINAPKAVVAHGGGKLVRLKVSEGQVVNKDDIIGYVESTASHDDVLAVSSFLETVDEALNKDKLQPLYSMRKSFSNLGELQLFYQTFMQSFSTFQNYLDKGFYLKKRKMLDRDINYLQRLHETLLQQKDLQNQDMELTQKTFDMNKNLKDEKVISELDYRIEKSRLLNKKLSLPQINALIISNESQQNDKQKEILELENLIIQQKTIFQYALYTFTSQVEAWKAKYMLIAPIDGKVAFATFLQENQQLTVNHPVCYINPENSEYYTEIFIPQANFAKVTLGQQVLLKLPSYPWQEYGFLTGRLVFISNVPSDSGYVAKVSMNGLVTNYNKKIQFRDGLVAHGEIVTKDMRLLERFYYNLVMQL